MENLIRVYLPEIVVAFLGIAGSIAILHLLKKKPEKLGFETRPAAKMYLLAP